MRERTAARQGTSGPAALLVVLALAGCGPAVEDAPADPTGPLTALPACEEPAPPIDEPPGEGVVLPEGARLLEQVEQGPAINAAGYVELTPIEVRLAYEALAERDGLMLLSSEDEVFEAELLLEADGRRIFVRATAACDRGSNLLVVSAPAGADAAVPTPQGDGTVTD